MFFSFNLILWGQHAQAKVVTGSELTTTSSSSIITPILAGLVAASTNWQSISHQPIAGHMLYFSPNGTSQLDVCFQQMVPVPGSGGEGGVGEQEGFNLSLESIISFRNCFSMHVLNIKSLKESS